MNPILIFGASTRAAAFSAIRAGLDPICGDMFADADLRRWAIVVDVPRYPLGLADAVGHLSPMPFLYTGGLENSPAELDRLGKRHHLWGNGSDSLRLCRDPWFCRDVLQAAGLPALDLCSSKSPPPRDGQWMLKPRRSAAGRAISIWGPETNAIHEPHYFQQRIEGLSLAAAFLASPHSIELLGISRQLIGLAELNAPEFGYCGSIFPWNGEPQWENLIRRMATTLADKCGLRGLFGIDLIHDGRTMWLTEVNPRYTASMELIEFSHHQPLIDWHRRCGEEMPARDYSDRQRKQLITSWDSPDKYCAKVILYANRHARAPDLSDRMPRAVSLGILPDLADIPVAGTEIHPGQPVFTCLGKGLDSDRLLEELVTRANKLWATFRDAESINQGERGASAP